MENTCDIPPPSELLKYKKSREDLIVCQIVEKMLHVAKQGGDTKLRINDFFTTEEKGHFILMCKQYIKHSVVYFFNKGWYDYIFDIKLSTIGNVLSIFGDRGYEVTDIIKLLNQYVRERYYYSDTYFDKLNLDIDLYISWES